MPRKKKEDELQVEETSAETIQGETAEVNAAEEAGVISKSGETNEGSSIVDSVINTVSSVVSGVAEAVTSGVSAVAAAVSPDSSTTENPKSHHSNRAEKIGIVQSDKMTKTVTVRVDRVVKHPVYRKYIKRRKKFMAHDELGAAIGDKVRIIETRPLSAKKRWRVIEIVQKAEK